MSAKSSLASRLRSRGGRERGGGRGRERSPTCCTTGARPPGVRRQRPSLLIILIPSRACTLGPAWLPPGPASRHAQHARIKVEAGLQRDGAERATLCKPQHGRHAQRKLQNATAAPRYLILLPSAARSSCVAPPGPALPPCTLCCPSMQPPQCSSCALVLRPAHTLGSLIRSMVCSRRA